MDLSIIESLGGVWVPKVPVPCQSDPQQWTDAVKYEKLSPKQHQAITYCMFECKVRLDCLIAALREEGSDKVNYRVGIRGGTLPKERYQLYKESIKKKRLKRVLDAAGIQSQ